MDTSAFHGPLSFENLAVTNGAAVSITETKRVVNRVAATHAKITVETNSVRYKTDGNDPATATPGEGHLVAAGSTFDIYGESNIKNFRVISTDAGGSALAITLEAI